MAGVEAVQPPELTRKSTSLAIVESKFCNGADCELTVRKTSVFYPGDGFAAYSHATGELVFRVDSYAVKGPSLSDELVLMDADGKPLLTLRRKWPSLHQRWEGYIGERCEGQKPIFSVRRSSIFGGNQSGITVEVSTNSFNNMIAGEEEEYRVEGNFAQRCCKVLYQGRGGKEEVVVAEITRKVDEGTHVMVGRDVFSLSVKAGCDAAFAMGVVIAMDQMGHGDEGMIEGMELLQARENGE